MFVPSGGYRVQNHEVVDGILVIFGSNMGNNYFYFGFFHLFDFPHKCETEKNGRHAARTENMPEQAILFYVPSVSSNTENYLTAVGYIKLVRKPNSSKTRNKRKFNSPLTSGMKNVRFFFF